VDAADGELSGHAVDVAPAGSGVGRKVPTTVWPVIEVTLPETPLS
jgi:hypothetical protein